MAFAELLGRQQAAIFRTLGERATWSGVASPIQVICRERDDLVGFGQSEAVRTVRFARVLKADVAAPAEGDRITRATGPVLEVMGEPRLDRKGGWICEVREV